MGAKKRILGIVFGLGIVLCLVSQLRWLAPRAKVRMPEAAPTNAVEKVAMTNAVASAQTNAVAAVPQKAVVETTVSPVVTNAVAKPKPRPAPIANDPKIPKARQVLLANRRIAIAAGRSFPKQFCAAQTPTARGTAPYVVISEVPVSRDVRIRAMADGARVIGFLPNNALLVEADAQTLKNLEEDVLFTAAVEFEPTDKIQRALAEAEGETVEATVVLLNPEDREAVSAFVTDNGGTLLPDAGDGKSVSVAMPQVLVEKLAGKAEVKWIERRAKLKIDNDLAVQPGLMNVTPVWDNHGLTGAGQIITTSDTGIDTGDMATLHEDLRNAVIGMEAVATACHKNDTSGHGTHTAGSIVGDGSLSDGQVKGTAYGAKLWAWCMMDSGGGLWTPELVDDLFRPHDIAANVHSASWGFVGVEDWGGVYDSDYCEPIDEYVWHHADFLPVFSAGNEGAKRDEYAVMPPGTAKNMLTVGACNSSRYGLDPDEIASFSSCGPCQDGRIKPDVVAPGTYVYSTRVIDTGKYKSGLDRYYCTDSGTSMACPLAAGTAALVREWLAKFRHRQNPSAALVKAVLTGGATDLAPNNEALKSVPDMRQGWGRVDLGESVFPTNGLAVYMKDWLPFAAGSNFTFRVTTTNAAPLNVQLVWVDYPGSVVADETAPVLVNDLDLVVSAVTNGVGGTWLGNGGAAADAVNTVESVRIRVAPSAAYAVRVACKDVRWEHDEGGAAAIYIRGAFDPKTIRCEELDGTMMMIR